MEVNDGVIFVVEVYAGVENVVKIGLVFFVRELNTFPVHHNEEVGVDVVCIIVCVGQEIVEGGIPSAGEEHVCHSTTRKEAGQSSPEDLE